MGECKRWVGCGGGKGERQGGWGVSCGRGNTPRCYPGVFARPPYGFLKSVPSARGSAVGWCMIMELGWVPLRCCSGSVSPFLGGGYWGGWWGKSFVLMVGWEEVANE